MLNEILNGSDTVSSNRCCVDAPASSKQAVATGCRQESFVCLCRLVVSRESDQQGFICICYLVVLRASEATTLDMQNSCGSINYHVNMLSGCFCSI